MSFEINNQRVIVTGATGFIGSALVLALIDRGAKVVALSRTRPKLSGIEHHQFDLEAPRADLAEILKGASAVFHVAAKVAMWGDKQEFYRANVEGTKALLAASKHAGVARFIFTSSPSVVASGRDLRNVNESQPYPSEYHAYYPETKALAEQAVLAASNAEDFLTIALRPHLVFGPGDTSLTATVLESAKAGRLKKIGSGQNRVDFTFIDDCVAAHLCALEAPVEAFGRAYFISQGDPYPLWSWVDRILQLHGLEKIKKSVPFGRANFIARCLEGIWRTFRLAGQPPLTRFLVEEMATDHYFDISAARKQLGYQPRYSIEQALQRCG